MPLFDKLSEPFSPFEDNQHNAAYGNHDPHHNKIPCLPAQLRHILEVHSVNTCNERERNENGRDNREDLHYLIGLITDIGDVQVEYAGIHVPHTLQYIDGLNGIVVQIPEIGFAHFAEQTICYQDR